MEIGLTVARGQLPRLLDRVAAGEEVTITRHGKPVAVLVRPDRLRARVDWVFEDAERLRLLLESDRDTPPASGSGLSAEFAETLLAEVRAGRDRDSSVDASVEASVEAESLG